MLTEEKTSLDVQSIRADFPILQQLVRGELPLVYLDNAATTQKPQSVIDAVNNFYAVQNGTVRRGVYFLSEKATLAFEEARKEVAKFINAASSDQVVFVRGCTEAINLVARSFGGSNLQAGDEVLISALEHHANIVPWQLICQEKGAILKVVPINQAGEIILDEYEKLLGPRTKIVSVGHISNALGTINPIKQIIDLAHKQGTPVLIDGAQGAPHTKLDMQALDCDFYTFSGHKIFGPTGIGVLYGKTKYLQAMPPYQGGGDMIETVSFEKSTYAPVPQKFEAGTPAIAQAIGLKAALDYISKISIEQITAYEHNLLQYATNKLSEIEELKIIGTAKEKASLISFVLQGVHPHDIGTILDQEFGIAVRAGHHCAQPLMKFYNVPATTRASFAMYNTKTEIDLLVIGIKRILEMFK
jgi:cysteine desulfurase / selenocysteine lyase